MNAGIFDLPANQQNGLARLVSLGSFVPALNSQKVISHPFSKTPVLQAQWVCIANDNGWVPGDRIFCKVGTTGSQGLSITLGADGLVINFATTTLFSCGVKSTNAVASATVGKWALEIKAIG